MKSFTKFSLLLVCSLVCNISVLYAQPKYPTKALGRPKCFEQNYSKSYDWENILVSHNFGEYTNNPWIVYICNQDAKVYEAPNGSREINHDILFMEDFYVAALQGDYALLFYSDSKLGGEDGLEIPNIIAKRKSTLNHRRRTDGYIGWVNIDDLLLWNLSPKTEDGIFQKITVVKDVNIASDFNSMPQLYQDANCTKALNMHINALDFYFTLKKSNTGNALVYVNYQLEGRMVGKKVGWVKAGEYIDWNTRICWEPAFGDGINDYAYTFNSERSLINRVMNDKASTARLTGQRFDTQYEPRSPVVNYDPSSSIAFLSVLANRNAEDNSHIERQRQLDIMKKSLSQINVVFVMDATNSMKSCFNAMSKAVQQIAEYRYNSNVRFGAVVYRNYDDAPNSLVESTPLTDDFDKVKNFLSSVRCYSVSQKHQEAMFYGLNYAVDNMQWNEDQSNFIILISDVTSKSPDARGNTTTSVANKLVSKNINLVAFQARSQQDVVYQNFGAQICDIINSTLRNYGYPTTNISYDNKTQIFYYNKDYTKLWPLRPMGYKFKESDEQNIIPSELTDMATNIIKDFIITTSENIEKLDKSISGGSTEIDQSICEALIRKGVIEKCEDLKGTVRISGFTRRLWVQEKRMFVPCVFLADKELNDLIRDLEQVTKGTVVNTKGELQKVFKKLILSYTGQQLTADAMTDFKRIIESIELECGYTFDYNVKKHVLNPNQLSDSEVQQLVNRLKNSIRILKAKQNDSSTYKEQDGNKYYYILLEDMPLVTRQ